VAAVRDDDARVPRVDVRHERLSPALMMRRLVEEEPTVALELSSRRSVALALSALLRGEVDLTLGRGSDRRPLLRNAIEALSRISASSDWCSVPAGSIWPAAVRGEQLY